MVFYIYIFSIFYARNAHHRADFAIGETILEGVELEITCFMAERVDVVSFDIE